MFRGRRRWWVGLLGLALVAGLNPPAWGDPKGPTATDRQIAITVSSLLRRDHVTRHPLDDEISRRGLQTYLKNLDSLKVYFYQSDVDAFLKRQDELDNMTRHGDIRLAYEIFRVFLQRIDERVTLVDELLAMPHDFAAEETMIVDGEAAHYPEDEADARDRWRKRIKYDLLNLKLEKVEGKAAVEKLSRRYHSFAKRMHQTDDDELLETYLTAITTSFDPHTTYMSPTTLKNFEISMRLELEGIGAALTAEDGYTVVAQIIPGGAADKDGRLKPKDKIIGVGQNAEGEIEDVVDMKLSDVVDMIRGPADTVVRLQVVSVENPEPAVISITREKVELTDQEAQGQIFDETMKPSAREMPGATVPDDKLAQGSVVESRHYKIGVIDLPSFYMDMDGNRHGIAQFRSTTRDVRTILDNFNAQGVDAVILDLRRNGGGALQEAINLTGLFIENGPVVQVKDADGNIIPYQDPDGGIVWRGPLVVLISKFSASASEILAGAIQDYQRGLIVGDHSTHGKGTVQSLVDVANQLFPGDYPGRPNLGALKITIQHFYRPSGDSTQDRGVVADIELPSLTTHLDVGESDLDYALAFDRVPPLNFQKFNFVNDTIRTQLARLSAQRCERSDDFKKVVENIKLYNEKKDTKSISLNEEKFMAERESLNADDEQQKQIEELTDPNRSGIQRDYYLDEAMAIARDYLQMVMVAQSN